MVVTSEALGVCMYVCMCVCNYSSQTTEPICIKIVPANRASYADCYRLLRFEIFTPTIFKTPQKGAWIGIFKLNSHNIETHISNFENPKIEKSPYLGLGSSDFYEIWHTDALITTCPGIDIALEEGFD